MAILDALKKKTETPEFKRGDIVSYGEMKHLFIVTNVTGTSDILLYLVETKDWYGWWQRDNVKHATDHGLDAEEILKEIAIKRASENLDRGNGVLADDLEYFPHEPLNAFTLIHYNGKKLLYIRDEDYYRPVKTDPVPLDIEVAKEIKATDYAPTTVDRFRQRLAEISQKATFLAPDRDTAVKLLKARNDVERIRKEKNGFTLYTKELFHQLRDGSKLSKGKFIVRTYMGERNLVCELTREGGLFKVSRDDHRAVFQIHPFHNSNYPETAQAWVNIDTFCGEGVEIFLPNHKKGDWAAGAMLCLSYLGNVPSGHHWDWADVEKYKHALAVGWPHTIPTHKVTLKTNLPTEVEKLFDQMNTGATK